MLLMARAGCLTGPQRQCGPVPLHHPPRLLNTLLTSLLQGPRARWVWRCLLALLLIVIGYLALSPVPPKELDTGWDKLNHLLAFGSLAFCGHWSLAGRRARRLGLPLVLLAYGGLIEILQLQVPGRSGEWADLLADGLGITAGLLVAVVLLRALRR